MIRAVAAACTLALAACAIVPDVGPKRAPKSVDDYAIQRTIADSNGEWPSDAWWRAFNDAQLTALIDEGLQAAPSIALANARLLKADALLEQTRAVRFPNVSAGVALAESRPSYNTGLPTPPALHGWNDTARLSLDAAYEIDFWGKNRAAIAAAVGDVQAARAELGATRLLLSAAIAAEYAELNALQKDRAALERTLQVREQTLALVQRRFQFGYDSEADLRQAEAGPPTLRAQLVAADERISISRLRLAALIGSGPDRALQFETATVTRIQGLETPATLPAELLEHRPDVAAARRRAESAADRIDVALAQFKPSVNLLALLGRQSLGIDDVFADGSGFGSIGALISMPVFDGGRRAGNYRAAHADYDAALAVYEATLVQALQEIAAAMLQHQAVDARLIEDQAALAANTRALELARARFTAGAADLQSVLLAEDRLLASERAVAADESRRIFLQVALIRALGGGWTPPVP
ncbi:multidrug resistance protein [Steroidobacter agaridevorans]|uniref:Multidrug resistance protein n=1 Tax=Steroidobacter agaridevorans TaxID=2695856 RepID=A0A829YI04_9GAMM|nr:efflux transporter outer membrane subunit [Steroidobacter agaridevorans]GFE82809.1 multidrug resistance protein [Steroidobacter agaridevorans]GFE85893.1 multidrug resistance protein [Steroidobacter agaridevorans]